MGLLLRKKSSFKMLGLSFSSKLGWGSHITSIAKTAPSCYLELLDKLPLAHRQNLATLSIFYRYYFGRCSSELAILVPLSDSRGKSTLPSGRLHDFSVTIPRCYKNVFVNSFFPCTARLWNSLTVECFPLTYDLMALSLELTDTFYL